MVAGTFNASESVDCCVGMSYPYKDPNQYPVTIPKLF